VVQFLALATLLQNQRYRVIRPQIKAATRQDCAPQEDVGRDLNASADGPVTDSTSMNGMGIHCSMATKGHRFPECAGAGRPTARSDRKRLQIGQYGDSPSVSKHGNQPGFTLTTLVAGRRIRCSAGRSLRMVFVRPGSITAKDKPVTSNPHDRQSQIPGTAQIGRFSRCQPRQEEPARASAEFNGSPLLLRAASTPDPGGGKTGECPRATK